MRVVVLALLGLSLAGNASAQTFTLALLKPAAVGAAGTGLDADSYYFHAYPAMPYIRRAVVEGGTWPYTFALSNAPAGMTVENAGAGETCGIAQSGLTPVSCGLITWANPDTTATNVELCVTDAVAAESCQTWTVTVGTSGWIFADDTTDASGTGTIADPYDTVADLHASSGANSRCVLRAGTYTLAGISVTNADNINGEERIEWTQPNRCVTFLAYPGEAVTLDFEYAGDGCGSLTSPTYDCGQSVPRIRLTGDSITLDGFTVTNCMTQCFQFEARTSRFGVTVHDMTFDGTGPGINGGNSGFLMWVSTAGSPSYWDSVTDSSFDNITHGSSNTALKLYGIRNSVIERNYFGAMNAITGNDEAILAIKGDALVDMTVRGNDFADTHATSIGGNMASTPAFTAEISYNRVRGSGTGPGEGALTLGVAEVTPLGAVAIFRNTFVGQVVVDNLGTGEGPYAFDTNVIVNAGGTGGSCPQRVTCGAVTDYGLIDVDASNLQGAAGDAIVDAAGALTGSYRTTYLGTRGYELQAIGTLWRLRVTGEQ